MSTIPQITPSTSPDQGSGFDAAEELHNGDRMTQAEFHRIYSTMPKDVKAELIEGIVYMASPLKRSHSTRHVDLAVVFGLYRGHTPGVEAGDNGTVILGDESEPQPDLYLRILPSHGGQSKTTKSDYVQGAPELVSEVAHSSRTIDLHAKRRDYTRAGVREYIVWNLRERKVHWFNLQQNREMDVSADGLLRSFMFPGLRVDISAAFAGDFPRLVAVLNNGLATPDHQAFVERLKAAAASTTK